MRLFKTSALLPLAFLLFCAGCQGPTQLQTVTEERVTKPQVPADLTEPCQASPAVPGLSSVTQHDVGDYIADLSGAGDDCRRHYDALRGVVLQLEGLK